jgi:hypothetical protein
VNQKQQTKMKRLIIILFTITSIASAFLCSCNRTKNKTENNWTESQKRQYFQDSIAYRYCWGTFITKHDLNDFNVFMDSLYPEINAENKYNPFVYAFEEAYVDTANIDSLQKWIRIIIAPCWLTPVCILLEKRNGLSYLTTKITNAPMGGYYTGVLLLELTKVFPDTLYDNVLSRLHKLNYFELQDVYPNCSDGDMWYFEGMENGNYNYSEQYCLYSSETDPTRIKLYAIGCYLLELGTVLKPNYLLNNPWDDDLGIIESLVDTNDFKHEMIGGL